MSRMALAGQRNCVIASVSVTAISVPSVPHLLTATGANYVSTTSTGINMIITQGISPRYVTVAIPDYTT